MRFSQLLIILFHHRAKYFASNSLFLYQHLLSLQESQSCSFSLVRSTFLIISLSAPRYFNRSSCSLCRSLRKNTDAFWSPRKSFWNIFITLDRAIHADSEKIKTITLLKIGVPFPVPNIPDFSLKFISTYHFSLSWCIHRIYAHCHTFIRARIKMK